MALKLTARQRRYLRDHGTRASADASELSDELNIVPYLDVVVNLIMFLLMVISSVAFFTQVNASLPTLGRGGGATGPAVPQLNLNVTLAERGIIVAGASGKLAPGCETTQTGDDAITVPRTSAGYNWTALTACIVKVKAEFPDETKVTVSADPLVTFQDLLGAMDAVRMNDTDELFTDVVISAGVR